VKTTVDGRGGNALPRAGHSLRAPLPQAGRARSGCSGPLRGRPLYRRWNQVAPSRDPRRSACACSTLSLASACSKSRSGNARPAWPRRPEPRGHQKLEGNRCCPRAGPRRSIV